MNPAAFLRRGIAPTPSLPASGLSTTFGQVSFNGGGQSQGCKKGLQIIRCGKFSRASSSNSGRGGPPLANAKMAVESLLCFSLDTAAEDETKDINAEKKRALQILLGGNNPKEAVKIMTNLQNKYIKRLAIKYEATLALIQILIHIGTIESLGSAIDQLNLMMAANERLPSDARIPFYRAVIYTLLGDIVEAKNYWRTYTGAVGSGPGKR